MQSRYSARPEVTPSVYFFEIGSKVQRMPDQIAETLCKGSIREISLYSNLDTSTVTTGALVEKSR